jgi:hypothetical protein
MRSGERFEIDGKRNGKGAEKAQMHQLQNNSEYLSEVGD